MIATLSSLFFEADELQLNQQLDASTLEIVKKRVAKKQPPKYTLERCIKQPSFDFAYSVVRPTSIISDLAEVFKISKSFMYQAWMKGSLRGLTDRIQVPVVLVNFHQCTKIQKLPTSATANLNIPLIIRLDYGTSFWAIFEPTKKYTAEDVKQAFEDHHNNKTKSTLSLATICFATYLDNHFEELSATDREKYLSSPFTPLPSELYRIHVTHLKNASTTTIPYDEIVNEFLACQNFAATLTRNSVFFDTTGTVGKIDEATIEALKTSIQDSLKYPAESLGKTIKVYQKIWEMLISKQPSEVMLKFLKALKELLKAAIEAQEKFHIPSGSHHWYLKTDEAFMESAPRDSCFYLHTGPINDESLEKFAISNNLILASLTTLKAPQKFYLPGVGYTTYSYMISTEQPYRRLPPSISKSLFLAKCPCKKNPVDSLWICSQCQSFYSYHSKKAKVVSCKCGSYDLEKMVSYDSVDQCCQETLPMVNQAEDSGVKDSSKTQNVIIMGASGTGKSTLINAIAKYLQHETLKEAAAENKGEYVIPCKFEVQDEDYESHVVEIGDISSGGENFNSDGHSVTQEPQEYYFESSEGVKLRLIDTPGLADTRGIEQDSENLQKIKKVLGSIESLHAICFVLKPNESKFSIAFQATMLSLLSLFPNEAMANVVFCFTNSRGTLYNPGDSIGPINKLISMLKDNHHVTLPFQKSNVFCMDNEGFRYLCAKYRNIEYTNATFEDYEHSWTKSREATLRFFNYLATVKPFNTQNLNFYSNLSKIGTQWSETIKKHGATKSQLERFGLIVGVLRQNLRNSIVEDLVQFADNQKCLPYWSKTIPMEEVMDNLHQEYIAATKEDLHSIEIKLFVDSYRFKAC